MNAIVYPVTEPDLRGREKQYVNEALDEGWISSNGRFIARFEREFASFCGTRHAISCCNGTVALHLILAALGLGPGDEVLVPSFTYIASANAIAYTGATPVLVDSSLRDWTVDPEHLQEALTPATRALIAVHLYGRPCNMRILAAFAARHGLLLIEDSAEAHGAKVDGRSVGGLGLASAFSFYGNKIITTGEGGMVTTDDDALAARLRLLKGQGMDPDRRYWFGVMGYNYRMTNLAAAIGCAQLERVQELLEIRCRIASWYIKHLQPSADRLGITWLLDTPAVHQVHWLFSLRVPQECRDRLMQCLLDQGIDSRPFFTPLHVMPVYAHARHHGNRPLQSALELGQTGLSLPTYTRLTEEDVSWIVQRILAFLEAS